MSVDLAGREDGLVATSLDEGVLAIRLNDPEALNALSLAMMDELAEILHAAHHDSDVRVVLLTGTGRAFCAGGNVKAMGDAVEAQQSSAHPLERPLWNVPSMSVDQRLRLQRQTGREIMVAIYQLDKPTIAAVNGLAAGAGCDLSLVCDIRFAARSARFSEIYVRRGLVPADGGMYWMPRIVGIGRAFEILYSGDWVSSEEAERIGLVNRLVEDDELLPAAVEFAKGLARGPALALQSIKWGVRQTMMPDFAESLETSYRMCEYLLRSHDHNEAVEALKGKRQPNFSGN